MTQNQKYPVILRVSPNATVYIRDLNPDRFTELPEMTDESGTNYRNSLIRNETIVPKTPMELETERAEKVHAYRKKLLATGFLDPWWPEDDDEDRQITAEYVKIKLNEEDDK